MKTFLQKVTFMSPHRLLSALGTLCLSAVLAAPAISHAQATPSVASTVVADVSFPGMLQLHGTPLLLNGAGLRHKLVFKVYAIGMYFPHKAATQEEAQNAEGPKRIRLVPLRTINAEELSRLFLRSLEANIEKDVFYKLAPSMLQISQVFTDIKKLQPGDDLIMDWVPGTGTIVTHNGQVKSNTFKDREFFDALMSIWLGPQPADPSLKEALLGHAAPNHQPKP